ncbi:MAG: nuclease superfamily [Bacteroidota bacterium]|nr:nuclease superfamily [Bacteroidota bacterium]
MSTELNEGKYPLKDETFRIIGICMEVHNALGKGF